MSKYTYTFDIKGVAVEMPACNLVTACEKVVEDKYGLSHFRIEKRGNHYLMSTPFNERTHIVVFNSTHVCEVKQKRIYN